MDRRAILLEMRQNGKLKGLKPCFVMLKPSQGKIYNGGSGTFVMSIRDSYLYFQKLSTFLHRLQPRDDFQINFRRFSEYKVEKEGAVTSTLYLYTNDGEYLDIKYLTGTRETLPTEDNLARIYKIFEESGIIPAKDVDLNGEEESNAGTEESN